VSHTTPINFKRPFRDIPRGEKRTELKDIPSNGEVDSVAVNVFFLFQLPSMRIPPLSAIPSPTDTQSGVLQHRPSGVFFWSIHTIPTMSRQHILPSWGFLVWPSLLGLVGFASPLLRFAGGLEGALLSASGNTYWTRGLDLSWLGAFVLVVFAKKINRLSFPPLNCIPRLVDVSRANLNTRYRIIITTIPWLRHRCQHVRNVLAHGLIDSTSPSLTRSV
jgi:hypothetical protein